MLSENFSFEETKATAAKLSEELSQIKADAMTFGMQLVGITFNPSGDAKVNKAKELCAQLADLVSDDFHANGGEKTSFLKSALYTHTVGEILNAQMNVVKLLTLKY